MHNFGIILGLTGLYFFIILAFVVYARFKSTKSFLPGLNEFFLAGKSLHPMVLVFTYAASLFSTFSILGMPALSYTHGIGAGFFLFITVVTGSIFFLFLGRRLRRFAEGKRIFSPVEIISQSYDSRKLGLFLAIVFSIFLMPYISLQLVGVGAFIEAYTQGQISYMYGVGSMMLIILIYLFLGGMRAVAYTDFIQLSAMIVGLLFGAIYLLNHYDLSLMDIFQTTQNTSPEHFSLPGPKGFYTYSMLISASMILVGIFAQPHLLTRALMAKNDHEIRYMSIGSVIGTTLVVAFGLFYGLYAYNTFGSELKPNLMMGSVFTQMASLGILGVIFSTLMLMGALGAAMSTADSLLISIGQVSTRDMVRPFFQINPKKQVLLSKGIMSVVLVAAFVTGINPPQFMTDLALYSAAGCALIIPTIMCFEWKKRSLLASYLSITVGIILLAITVMYKINTGSAYAGVHPGTFPLIASFVIYFGTCFLQYARQSKPCHP